MGSATTRRNTARRSSARPARRSCCRPYLITTGRSPKATPLRASSVSSCRNMHSPLGLARRGLVIACRVPSNDESSPHRAPMVRPLAVRRHNEIVQRLRAAGSVSVGELANIFSVSHETIRRDLKLLAENGHLDVVHGGAARRGMMEPSIAQGGEENAEGKAAIAREAARMVADAGSVLIDSGTTTAALTYELVGRPGLTVFTNSLNHALTLCRVSGNRVVMLGGEIDSNDEAVFGTGTSTGLDAVRADIAFIGVGGFAGDGGRTH